MDLLPDLTHAHIRRSVHTALIFVAAAPMRTPHSHNSNRVLAVFLLSVHTPYATTEHLMAVPVHRLMVALVLILPPNGRDQIL